MEQFKKKLLSNEYYNKYNIRIQILDSGNCYSWFILKSNKVFV